MDESRISSADAWLRGPVALAVIVLLTLAWSLPLTANIIGSGDFPDHLRAAASMAAAPHIPTPHFLYFAVVAVLLRIVPGIAVPAAGIAAVAGFMAATSCVVWWYLRQRAANTPAPLLAAIAVSLIVVGPILPPTLAPDMFLIGFFVPNPYHNATILAAKPFALLLAICAAAALGLGRTHVAAWAAAIVVVLCALAKPNYVLCLVPALAFFALGRLIMRRRVEWPLLLAIGIPAAAIALAMRAAYGASGIAVIVAPFAAIGFHTAVDATLALKLLASIAFPAVAIVAWPALVAKNGELAVAWAAMGVALLQGYLLAEAGPRMDHANLLAGASLATFVLMATTCAAVLARALERRPGDALRLTIVGSVFALHAWGGLRHALVPMMSAERWLTPFGYVALGVAGLWLVSIARPMPVRP